MSYLIVFNFVPLVLIAVLYIIIYLKLKSQMIPGEQSANAGQQRQQRERNVLKMAIVIVLGFAMCWLPFAISSFIPLFIDIGLNCGVPCAVHFLSLANCAVNSCICFAFSSNYRKELTEALLRLS